MFNYNPGNIQLKKIRFSLLSLMTKIQL